MSQKSEAVIVEEALNKKYIFTKQMAEMIATAHFTGKNVIFFGPAGHGKSEMTLEALHSLGYSTDAPDAEHRLFIQSFGEGMTEDRLYGGLNFKKLNDEHICEYNAGSGIGASFLDCGVAIFEEIFDAPPKVLLSLKDTLTSGYLRNGPQMVKSKCRVIIANTNHNPEDIADLGPAAKALIERFPLQQNVYWNEYTTDSYKNMFKTVIKNKPYRLAEAHLNILSELCTESHNVGITISPRTAIHALDILGMCVDGDYIELADYDRLRLIPELCNITNVSDKFQRQIAQMEFEQKSKVFKKEFKALDEEAQTILSAEKPDNESVVKFIKAAKEVAAKLQDLQDRLNGAPGTDVNAATKTEITNKIKARIEELAYETDRVLGK